MKESIREKKFYYLLVQLFVIVAVIGLVLLFLSAVGKKPSEMLFSIIAFVISVAALVMTTLQSLSIARQVRLTHRSAKLVYEATRGLDQLVKQDKKLEREIHQDIDLDHEIITILEEYGIGTSKNERTAVAEALTKKIKHHSNKK